MKVSELIEKLKACPQDMEIKLYYDGDARLVPNFAFQAKQKHWDTYPETWTDLVVLGQADDIYNLERDENWGGKTTVLFDATTVQERQKDE